MGSLPWPDALRLDLPARDRTRRRPAVHLRGGGRGRAGGDRRDAVRATTRAGGRRVARGRRARGDRAGGGRKGRRAGAAGPRRARPVARRLLRLHAGPGTGPRRAGASEAAQGAGASRRTPVIRRRGGPGGALPRAARGGRPDRRGLRRGRRRVVPALRADRLREDRGLPAGVRGHARTGPRRDRTRAGDLADAADGGPRAGAVRRECRDPALGAHGGRAPRRARADRQRRGAGRGGGALGRLRPGARASA